MIRNMLLVAVVLALAIVGATAARCAVDAASSPKGPDFGEDPPDPRRFEARDRVDAMIEERYPSVTHNGQKEAVWWLNEEGELEYLLWPRQRHARGLERRILGGRKRVQGTCDTDAECEGRLETMCKNAGHGGVDKDSVEITVRPDNSRLCSGSCTDNCNKNGCPEAFVECGPLQ